MTIYDIEHLPKKVINAEGIYDVLQAIDPELDTVRENVLTSLTELYITTVSEKYIRRWEEDFNITSDDSLTLEARRQQLFAKLAAKKTLTWENLDKVILQILPDENKSFFITNDSAGYSFTIVVQTDDYGQLIEILNKIKPAYITYTIVVSKYARRCGTFACGTNPI